MVKFDRPTDFALAVAVTLYLLSIAVRVKSKYKATFREIILSFLMFVFLSIFLPIPFQNV